MQRDGDGGCSAENELNATELFTLICYVSCTKKEKKKTSKRQILLFVRNLIPQEANHLFKVTQAFLSSQDQEPQLLNPRASHGCPNLRGGDPKIRRMGESETQFVDSTYILQDW